MNTSRDLAISLLLLRLGVAAVMVPWAVDKLVRPEHTAGVFKGFYMISALSSEVAMALGIVQLLIIIGFLAGFARTWTYGAILAMHAVSTISSWKQYLSPYEGGNLLFFAAWPMLAACIALFLLRDRDVLTVPATMRNQKAGAGAEAAS